MKNVSTNVILGVDSLHLDDILRRPFGRSYTQIRLKAGANRYKKTRLMPG